MQLSIGIEAAAEIIDSFAEKCAGIRLLLKIEQDQIVNILHPVEWKNV